MAKSKKQPTETEIKLEVAKSKSESLSRKVEAVYKLKGESDSLKHDVIWNLVGTGLFSTFSILSAADIINAKNPLGRAFLTVWWTLCAIEEGYSAYRVNKRKKDVDSDIVVLEDEIFNEAGITLVK